MPRCRQSGAYQRFGAVNCRLRSPLARDEGDLLLPEPVKRTILATKSPAVWRMSVYHHEAVDVDYQVTGQLASHTIGETSPWLISVFFRKVYITGLLGWLALGGCLLALRRPEPGIRFLMIWAIGLLLVFSVFPISLALPDFIRKVSSYMEIFITPLALLAGWFLAQQRQGVAIVFGGIMIFSGILLSGLEQQVVRVVTVNGEAAAAFAEAHPETPVFGPADGAMAEHGCPSVPRVLDDRSDIRPWADLADLSPEAGPPSDVVAYLVDDPQMRFWQAATKEVPLPESLRRCMVRLGPLEPSDLASAAL